MDKISLMSIGLPVVSLSAITLTCIGTPSSNEHHHGEYFELLDCNGVFIQDADGVGLLAK